MINAKHFASDRGTIRTALTVINDFYMHTADHCDGAERWAGTDGASH